MESIKSLNNFPYVGLINQLQCQPQFDELDRFADHETYLNQFKDEVDQLIQAGFLFSADAAEMINAASQSDIGNPNACP